MLKKILCLLAVLAAFAGGSPARAADEQAIFAGGCFWCMHAAFKGLAGVTKVQSGYTGGTVANPTYEQVSSGETGHVEAIEVTYDPAKVSYGKLLEYFWDNVDPTDPDGQFCDKGSQYAAGIFTLNDAQKKAAEASKTAKQTKYGKQFSAFVRPAAPFYVAEEYHQSYYKKNPVRYGLYEAGCGREQTLKKLHGGQ